MIRIDARTVELTDQERMAVEGYEEMLSFGADIPTAIRICQTGYPTLSEDFWSWLGWGAVGTVRSDRATQQMDVP